MTLIFEKIETRKNKLKEENISYDTQSIHQKILQFYEYY